MTIQDWSSMRHLSMDVYKIDIELLNKDTSLEIFISHFRRKKFEFSKVVLQVDKMIVNGYNGLSLSLKVIRTFLKEQKRFKY